jgi:hypothetical protein
MQLGVKIHCGVRSLLIPNSDGKNVNTATSLVGGSLCFVALRGECCESAWTRDERRGNERKTSLVSGREREIFLSPHQLAETERITAPTPCNDILTAKATQKLVLRHAPCLWRAGVERQILCFARYAVCFECARR